MAIRFEDSKGNIHTQGGSDPKVKVLVAGLSAAVKTSSIRRTDPPDVARISRLEARVEALEGLVAALSVSTTKLLTQHANANAGMLTHKVEATSSTARISIPKHRSVAETSKAKAAGKKRTDMAAYMRDKRAAKKLGISVKEYRARAKVIGTCKAD